MRRTPLLPGMSGGERVSGDPKIAEAFERRTKLTNSQEDVKTIEQEQAEGTEFP
jgi:hypothetical protein